MSSAVSGGDTSSCFGGAGSGGVAGRSGYQKATRSNCEHREHFGSTEHLKETQMPLAKHQRSTSITRVLATSTPV